MLQRINPIAPLFKEVLDALPESVWQSSTTTFCDLAMASGQGLAEVTHRLRVYGHSDENISQRIFGYEYTSALIDLAVNRYKLIGNFQEVLYSDIVNKGYNMPKFDVIIGNPPFGESDESGKRKSISTNLWSRFVDKSVNELLTENGHLAMITPASWAGPTKNLNGGRSILKDIMTEKNTKFICLDEKISNYFPGVGSTFSYYIIQNSPYSGTTTVKLGDNQVIEINLRDFDSLPRINNELAYSINKKYHSKVAGQVIAGQLQSKKIIQYKEKQDAVFCHLAYHTPANNGSYWYTNIEHPNRKDHKVIISLSGKYQPFMDKGTIGFSDMCLAYIVKENETVESAFSVINSKLFHFIMKCNKWSGFNNKEVIRKFALPPLDHEYTDDEIYNYFELTQEERDFVNENQ